MPVAIFDLDNTLIDGDSDHAWGEFLADQGLVDPVSHRRQNDQFYGEYERGELDIHAYMRFVCSTLARYDMADLLEYRCKFVADVITPMMLPRAQALVEDHRQRGDHLVVVTATLEFITSPIVALLQIPELIAPEPEIINERFTGEILGTPCYQDGKVTRLNNWLTQQGLDLKGSHFYSDSFNDLPLLDIVDHPVAVDPDPQLDRIAASRGWLRISLR